MCLSCYGDATFNGITYCPCNSGARDPHYTAVCLPSCPTGYTTGTESSICVKDSDVKTVFTSFPASGYSTCHEPSYHAERGAYFDGQDYLRFDDFKATSEHYFSIFFRARTSGYIFNYNFDVREENNDRNNCDDFDAYNRLESKKGDFNYFFDECDESDDMYRANFYGWKQLKVASDMSGTQYVRKVYIDGTLIETNTIGI